MALRINVRRVKQGESFCAKPEHIKSAVLKMESNSFEFNNRILLIVRGKLVLIIKDKK